MNLKYFTLNFGPQHPAAHGVLRLILYMDGEVIKHVDPHIGLLHRGTEKLLEYKTYLQGMPYFARLDYVSTLNQEHLFCLAIENMASIKVSNKHFIFRIIVLELSRILNHILAITTHALDVGAMTPFLWAFEEREKIMEMLERISGARLHTSFIRPGGVISDIESSTLNDIKNFCLKFKSRLTEIYDVLYNNRIWRQRLSDIGIISKYDALGFSLSGPLLRSSGLNWDIRKIRPYDLYKVLKFNIVTGKNGDCLDRFILRSEEIRESLSLIIQAIEFKDFYKKSNNKDYKMISNDKQNIKKSMESVINHFKYYTENLFLVEDDLYISSETPKGEFGVHIESFNSNKPSRVKIRSTGFLHLQVLNKLANNMLLADLVTIIGTLDLVFGEIDR